MVLPTEIPIKQEKIEFEESSQENHKPEECTLPNYDILVKIESGTELDLGFDVKTEIETDTEESYDDNEIGICYENLIDYCVQECPICFEKFWESYSLLRHNLKHLKLHLEPIDCKNQCKICSQYFVNANSLREHVNTHCGENKDLVKSKDHQCRLCEKSFTSYKNWHAHMQEVHSDRKYICEECKRAFQCRRYLRVHMKNVHLKLFKKNSKINSNDTYNCLLCPAITKCKNSLKTHMRNCHSEKVQCIICNSVLKSQSYLNAHIRRVHYDDGKKHYCHCGKYYRSPRYLKVHIKNAHSKR